MLKLKGTVTKVKLINTKSKTPLIYFRLDETNCLIAAHSLTFLADVSEDMQIVVSGMFNSRKQFVVRKYSVIGKTKIMIEFEAMKKTLA
ncbi:hypothetical protein [Enterococcus songbeiensis]|uniref:hypothetical protein n=1 Tax=Enterococcus songbeiensis TaxID=2559927 RepID=UPI0010F8D68A|nr:hypothetical protein [Enterococcus songbeiensis]